MGRPRGFADWSPQDATRVLIGQVQEVLTEYHEHLPLTVRQIFYRLVGQYGYDKTERAYARLCEHMVRARRAQMIGFDVIRDDGTAGGHEHLGWESAAAFWTNIEAWAEDFERNKMQDQAVRIELWCEAAGMVPQLERVATGYSVPVYSTGGFSSVTVTREIADRALKAAKPTVFLHVGDYDPSGESIFEAMAEDARMFVWQVTHGGNLDLMAKLGYRSAAVLRPERVALTEEQVEEHGLPTAPPKASDSRSVNWEGETCQCEAMPPDLLAQTVREAIEMHLDLDALDRSKARELRQREAIVGFVGQLDPDELEDD